MAITRHQRTAFKTDKGRNGAVSIIFIHVEITKKAAEMIHGGEKRLLLRSKASKGRKGECKIFVPFH